MCILVGTTNQQGLYNLGSQPKCIEIIYDTREREVTTVSLSMVLSYSVSFFFLALIVLLQ